MAKKNCEVCNNELTAENTPGGNGVNGFEIRNLAEGNPNETVAQEACNSCFDKHRKKVAPPKEAPAPASE